MTFQTYRRSYLAAVLLTVAIVCQSRCAGNPPPDTSQLSSQGLSDYNTAEKVRLIRDVNSGVIAANKAGLSDALTAQVLTVSEQLLDFLEANPQTTRDKALEALRQARDAMPDAVDNRIAGFLLQLSDIVTEVQR